MTPDYPDSSRIPQLRHLWKEAFGDEDAFLDLFFTRGFSPQRCRCITDNTHVIAALYWFETELTGARLAYIYAVATDPSYRNRGLCRNLMEDTHRLLAEKGYHGIILVPQTPGLAAMYENMGYLPCSSVSEFIAPAENTVLTARKLSPEEYARMRRQLLPPDGVIQEGANISFLDGFSLFYAGSDWVAALNITGKTLRCHELLGNPDIAYGLVSLLGCEEGHFRIPGNDIPFARFLPLREDCPVPRYFGLAFD